MIIKKFKIEIQKIILLRKIVFTRNYPEDRINGLQRNDDKNIKTRKLKNCYEARFLEKIILKIVSIGVQRNNDKNLELGI